MNLNQILIPILIFGAGAIAIVGFLFFLETLRKKGHLARVLNMSLFLVSLPKEFAKEGEPQKQPKELIAATEQFFASLANVKDPSLWSRFVYGPPHLAFEIATPQGAEEIIFYAAVPKRFETLVEKQIHGFYPAASIEKINDYNIFHPSGTEAGGYLKLKKISALPIKTYQSLEVDPLNNLTNALSKLGKEEGGVIQILLRPAPAEWSKRGKAIIQLLKRGKSLKQAIEGTGVSAGGILKEIFKVLSGPAKKEEEAPKVTEEELIKSLESKNLKAGFEVNIRLLASAENKERAKDLLDHLEAGFLQFNSPDLNSFAAVHPKYLKKLNFDFSFRQFNERQKFVLSTEELASVFHFPLASTETPKIKWLRAKAAPPPADLPAEPVLVLGTNVYRGEERLVGFASDGDRRRHLYVIGQTGTGKSSFMKTLVAQDLAAGRGVAVIDPHGDLIDDILGFIPSERAEDVLVFDPGDVERPVGLNMLEYDRRYPEQKSLVINEILGIFDKLYDLKATGGPMFEQYFRNTLSLLMGDPEFLPTLLEVPRVLSDTAFRKFLLGRCADPITKNFWELEAEKAGGEAALANIVPYITSKFNVFLANDIMRPIVAQKGSAFNFRDIMDNKKILLVNLAKGRLGDINSSLLGLIFVGKILLASFSRVDLPEPQRKDFYFYIDEFQNYATPSIATILSEARKYRLCLTIGHQFIGQLTEQIRDAVFGNVGTMASFRIGVDDAEFMEKQFAPVFSARDLINIDNYNAYVRMLINDKTSVPFNFQTLPPVKGNPEMAKAIRELSRLKYGKDRKIVEEEIRERYK